MPNVGRPKGQPRTGGRKKGTPNRLTMQAKEAIAFAFDGLGGAQGLLDWANESDDNKRVFLTQLFPKIVPLEVQGKHDVDFVDRTEVLHRAREEVRAIFGDRTGDGAGVDGGGLPH